MAKTIQRRQIAPSKKLADAAGVIRAGRKLRGLSQTDLAQHLGVSQSWVSKVESAQLLPNAEEWFEACQLYGVDSEDSFRTGLIDNAKSTVMGNLYPGSSIKLPKHLLENSASKVRAVRPFLLHFENNFGKKKLHDYLIKEKIDPDFFLILDNQISIRFLTKLMADLTQMGALNAVRLRELAALAKNPNTHGKLHQVYDHADSTKVLFRNLIQNSTLYENNFDYVLNENSRSALGLIITPQPHIAVSELKAHDLSDLVCRYKKHYFRQIASYGSLKQNTEISEHSCLFKGDSHCHYELQLTA